jgi:hypothetical protein
MCSRSSPSKQPAGDITELSIQGNEATFLITEHIAGVVKDEQGNTETVATLETSLDVMVRGPHGWQFKSAGTRSSQAPPA